LCVRFSGESVSACVTNPGCQCVRVRESPVSVCVMNPGCLCGVRARYV